MKKVLISLAVVSFFLLGTSKSLKAEEIKPCKTITSTCPNGVSYTAIVCDYYDRLVWDEIYCGLDPE